MEKVINALNEMTSKKSGKFTFDPDMESINFGKEEIAMVSRGRIIPTPNARKCIVKNDIVNNMRLTAASCISNLAEIGITDNIGIIQ